MNNPEIDKFLSFVNSENCKCLDSFEEFEKCCKKKYNLADPFETLMDMAKQIDKQNPGPRLKDMDPEEAKKILDKLK